MSSTTGKKLKRLKLQRRQLRSQQRALQPVIKQLVECLKIYANPDNWRPTDNTKDVKSIDGDLVIGVEVIHQWIGPTTGPEIAQLFLKQYIKEGDNAKN